MRRVVLLAFSASVAACSPKAPEAAAPSSPPEANAPPAARAARVVNATILTNGCEALGHANAKLAEGAMNRLVDGCTTVPGGVARFEATLLPGGRIHIAATPGQPDVIPICVLRHSLSHNVRLEKPCRLDVKIEESSVPMAVDAGVTR